MSQKIILATLNQGKIDEMQKILGDFGFEVHSQKDFNIPAVEEDCLTFVENAIKKARNVSKISGLPAIADDSGLVVEALNGKPGLLSSRFAGENATDADNRAKLLEEMKDVPKEDRGAYFICVLVFVKSYDDPAPIIATGRCYGEILTEEIGENGFGYDKLFFYPPVDQSFAQVSPHIKKQVSHRGLALQTLKKRLSLQDEQIHFE